MPKPIVHDPVLGELKYNPANHLQCYDGVAALSPGQNVEVHIYTEGSELEDLVKLVHESFAVIQRNVSEYANHAGRELLATYNENWNEGPPIDLATFVSQIFLLAIYFHPDGKVDLDFYDNELFLGHSIGVHLNETLNFVDAVVEC